MPFSNCPRMYSPATYRLPGVHLGCLGAPAVPGHHHKPTRPSTQVTGAWWPLRFWQRHPPLPAGPAQCSTVTQTPTHCTFNQHAVPITFLRTHKQPSGLFAVNSHDFRSWEMFCTCVFPPSCTAHAAAHSTARSVASYGLP